ncbi:hypothetical protein MHK_003539, partial [Candidatus Magnetomorum sp. HK-1]
TPRAKCTQNSHYDILDLTTLPDDYLPRTNYVPDCDEVEYRRRTPKFQTKDGKLTTVTDRCDREKDYEVVWREFERRFKDEGKST